MMKRFYLEDFLKLSEEIESMLPDLILIDGGKGQYSVVEVLNELVLRLAYIGCS